MSDAFKGKSVKNENNNTKRVRSNHVLRKRNPPKLTKQENAVYVTTKTGIKVSTQQLNFS